MRKADLGTIDEGLLYRRILNSIQNTPETTRELLKEFKPNELQDMVTRCLEIVGLCQKIQAERIQDIVTLKCPECGHDGIVGFSGEAGFTKLIPDSPDSVMCTACYHIWTRKENA